MVDDRNLVKIELRGEDDEVETLWAFELGDGRYKLDNTPWYAYSLSAGDVIEAAPEERNGFPVFRKVVEKSGYRTVRIVSEEDFADAVFEEIKGIGCSFEGANRRYVAIDVPPGVDLSAVADFLTAKGIRWEHADPTWEELYGEGP
jgi:hypothetical protein